jgi:hypothetical protein
MAFTEFAVLSVRIRAVPRHLRATVSGFLAPPTVDQDPSNPIAWVTLANLLISELHPVTRDLIVNHDLRPRSYELRLFAPEIREGCGVKLSNLRGRSPADALMHTAPVLTLTTPNCRSTGNGIKSSGRSSKMKTFLTSWTLRAAMGETLSGFANMQRRSTLST